MNKLVLIHDIRTYWEPIRAYLQKVVDKIHPDWIPEDIYTACRVGSATIYLAPDGVVVLRTATNEFSGKPELFIWAAYSNNGDAILEYSDDIDAIAASLNAVKIEFMSPRKGMEKAVSRLPGWKVGDTLYYKEV